MSDTQDYIYTQLILTRRKVLDAYFESVTTLRQIKAPEEVLEKLADEALMVLAEISKRIEAHPLHQKE